MSPVALPLKLPHTLLLGHVWIQSPPTPRLLDEGRATPSASAKTRLGGSYLMTTLLLYIAIPH